MSSLYTYLLLLRRRALVRSLRYLLRRDPFGLAISALILVLLAVIIGANAHRPQSALLLVVAHFGFVSFLHNLRKDAPFLAWLGLRPQRVFCLEYLLIALPSTIFLAFTPFPLTIFLPMLISCAFSLVSPESIGAFFFPQRFTVSSNRMYGSRTKRFLQQGFIALLPTTAFEWQGGLRERKVLIASLWGSVVFLAWQPFLLGIILFFLVLIPVEFYGIGEHRGMVQALYRSPSQFLVLKIKHGFGGYALLVTPLLCLGMTLHVINNSATMTLPQQISLVALSLCASLLISLLLASLCVLAKYAFYVEGLPFSLAVSTVVIVTVLTLWHPFISVIGLGVSFSLLIPKARKHLRLLASGFQ